MLSFFHLPWITGFFRLEEKLNPDLPLLPNACSACSLKWLQRQRAGAATQAARFLCRSYTSVRILVCPWYIMPCWALAHVQTSWRGKAHTAQEWSIRIVRWWEGPTNTGIFKPWKTLEQSLKSWVKVSLSLKKIKQSELKNHSSNQSRIVSRVNGPPMNSKQRLSKNRGGRSKWQQLPTMSSLRLQQNCFPPLLHVTYCCRAAFSSYNCRSVGVTAHQQVNIHIQHIKCIYSPGWAMCISHWSRLAAEQHLWDTWCQCCTIILEARAKKSTDASQNPAGYFHRCQQLDRLLHGNIPVDCKAEEKEELGPEVSSQHSSTIR